MADKKLAIKLGLVKEYWDELSRYSTQAYHRDNARYGRETTQRDDDWEKYNNDYNKAQSICKKIAATVQSKLPSGITFLMLVKLFNRVKKGELELPKDEPNSEESDNGLGLTPEEEAEYDRLDNMGQFTPDEIIKKIRSGQTEGVDNMRLDEASRNELISKTRIDNRDRYNKRLGYRPVTFDGVNIKELFDNGELVFTTKVGDYTNIIAVKGVLDAIKSAVKGKGKTTYADVLKAINSCLDKDGIRMDCTCADFCLTGDTRISLLDGRELSILDIVSEFNSGKELWTYSTDGNGDFKPGRITDAWKTGTSNNVYEVTLDNGEVIKCTGNHPFMLRDGTYKNAEDLEVGQSLMPLYLRINSKGYRDVLINSSNTKSDYKSVYKLVADEVHKDKIDELNNTLVDDWVQIHHIDFDKLNNNPDNLIPMSRMDHWKYHSDYILDRMNNDPEFYSKTFGKGHEYWSSEEGRKIKSEEMSRNISSWWASLTPEERKIHARKCIESRDPEYFSKAVSAGRIRFYNSMTPEERSEYSRKSINSSESINKAAKTRSATMKSKYASGELVVSANFIESTKGPRSQKFKDACSNRMKCMSSEEQSRRAILGYKNKVIEILRIMALAGIPITQDSYESYEVDRKPKWYKYYNSWSEVELAYQSTQFNHKVKSINKLDGIYDIYDITVDKWHNFRLSAGVVVSNTYRYKHWAYKGGYLYGDPGKAIEPPKYKQTNMDGRGSMCKHLASTVSRKEWIVKVAAAINNYIRLHKEECYPYLDLEVPPKKVDTSVVPEDETPIDAPIDGEETPLEEPTDQLDEEPIDDSSDEFIDDDVGDIVSDDDIDNDEDK